MKSMPSMDITIYIDGMKLLMDKKFTEAEKQFRKALAISERFAEAHNNPAYTLPKQGPDFYKEALVYYNRSIELKPDLDEPYMYRGVLYVQMGYKNIALTDHQTLVERKFPLASELQHVVENGREKEPGRFFGVSRRIDS
jgi:tetratricopeptide (TPR) repeat protein